MVLYSRFSLLVYGVLTLLFCRTFSRRHNLSLEAEKRKNFAISTFGFLKGGSLMVEILEFSYKHTDKQPKTPDKSIMQSNFGFSIEKTASDGVSNYMEQHSDKCVLQHRGKETNQVSLILFSMDLMDKKIIVDRVGSDLKRIGISNDQIIDNPWSHTQFLKSYVYNSGIGITSGYTCGNSSQDRKEFPIDEKKNNYYGRFTICIDKDGHEGLYNVYFHNCENYYKKGKLEVNLKFRIIEHNDNTFLSAGEIPLPILYGLMSVTFFVIGCVWIAFLSKHREWTFKIHYLMAALTLLKSFSLAFHAVNFYYIGRDGRPMETWAVLYYITHLLKGALLFTTIVLIGTGFFFVKQILSPKEKRIFIIVIPLQILTNVAQIMTESTEEGKAQYTTWHQIFILVDLICCGAILFPVVWSIRHLQEAAKTDGKAAISLAKLKLFRHFYVMIVCYIYFTRIIVYLIKITVPFKYMWLDEFFTEIASLVFFVLTGYKFRPAPTNPYLHVPDDDDGSEDEIEMNEINLQSGAAEGLTRLQPSMRRTETHTA